jgi:hypothetical protein
MLLPSKTLPSSSIRNAFIVPVLSVHIWDFCSKKKSETAEKTSAVALFLLKFNQFYHK